MELKTKISNEAIKNIDKIFSEVKADIESNKGTRQVIKTKIDEASQQISETMIKSLKKLAKLIDVDYLKVVLSIFGNESAEHSEKIEIIFSEASKIYEKGDCVLNTSRNLPKMKLISC